MDLTATYTFDVSPAEVWPLLIDPAVVAACLPGCETLEPIGEDRYRAVLTMGIAAISGQYQGTVALVDQHPPSAYRLVVEGRGKAGFVNGEAVVELAAVDGRTRLSVHGHAQVGGTIARVGQRLLTSVSKMMMDRFFACVRQRASRDSGPSPSGRMR